MNSIHKLMVATIATLSLASCGAPYDFRNAKSEAPVSVMEDKSVSKNGSVEISIDDMEQTRVHIYEIAKKYDAYIYYEKYTTVNVDQHNARIRLALSNESFLDCYNDLRKAGTLLSSEIEASLDTETQSSQSSDGAANNRPFRPSHLEIILSQPANLGDYTKTIFHGLGSFFNVALPILLVIMVILILGVIIYFIFYISIQSVIVKLHRKISAVFKKTK